MSNGGKGSAPRPYSVSQETYSNNWDAIFGKKKSIKSFAKPNCYCYNCNKDYHEDSSSLPYVLSHMITCPTCGYKRCPHATDHNLACTNSNEPDQFGSRY